ncbi:MAG: cysteine desulfurase [Actinobacteria bacterium]|nr:cysteine desulfurase [Actinomycetota bacterium]
MTAAKTGEYIYFDHAATTPVLPEVAQVMNKCFLKYFGNASEPHLPGRQAKKILEQSRHEIASVLGASDAEIVFTGSGTESDNMAIFGAAQANRKKGNHIITTSVEHPAVAMPCKMLEKQGFKVTYLPVDRYGMVCPDDLKKAITNKTILVSVMHANNIVGTIQPIEEIGSLLKDKDILFHTDAVQTFCSIKTDVKCLGVDLLSLSGHKIYGPKGVGALYIRKKTRIKPYIFGGGQERGRRSGTENTAGIAGLAKAASIAGKAMGQRAEHVSAMRQYLKKGIIDSIDDVIFNGHPEKRLPGNCNFSFRFVEGEAMVLRLDAAKIAVSSGSACSSSSVKPSHALVAMGLSPQEAYGSLRITLGYENTFGQVDYFLENLERIIKDLRMISPLKKG